MSIALVMPSNHLILCCHLLFLPSLFSSIRVFSNESTLRMRWPKYWSFSFSISPSNEQPGLINFRMDWLDLLAVQGTLKSLLQHHSSKDQFFGTQPSLQSITIREIQIKTTKACRTLPIVLLLLLLLISRQVVSNSLLVFGPQPPSGLCLSLPLLMHSGYDHLTVRSQGDFS